MKEWFRTPVIPHFFQTRRWWQIFNILVFGSASIWILLYSSSMQTWREQWRHRIGESQAFLRSPLTYISFTEQNPQTQLIAIEKSNVLHAAQSLRAQSELPPLVENTTLDKLARLLALESEENQSLTIPDNTTEILRSITPSPPEKVEVILLFVSSLGQPPNLEEQFASSSALLQKSITNIGIATRSAELENTSGTLIAIALSSRLASRAPMHTTTNQATFTGQDLWTAVQNYRASHKLPLFTQSNELCTVASIRVNELLELGKLDNHDGFPKRSDEFFTRHPDWTALNENIASGYQTAVQTVEWGWDQSLGHQALIQSTEYPKACAAANNGFSVLITGK